MNNITPKGKAMLCCSLYRKLRKRTRQETKVLSCEASSSSTILTDHPECITVVPSSSSVARLQDYQTHHSTISYFTHRSSST
ncbi:hypothetical protein B0T16DRAFT_407888 [Cercophora newfieldiana]|uniref:Uncharacterized protein n=1 Tax=Cercophora newfieldiana TaxID=92897 RepID=A0AA39YAW8_9PEZI|nr:hypothetical protein B0T16DRAFT_407888 [Cercophora newfieldiana]